MGPGSLVTIEVSGIPEKEFGVATGPAGERVEWSLGSEGAPLERQEGQPTIPSPCGEPVDPAKVRASASWAGMG